MKELPLITFQLEKLLRDVFAPCKNEHVVVLVDEPHGDIRDTEDWAERRCMAREWLLGFQELGCDISPLLRFPATGQSNADLPNKGNMDGEMTPIADILSQSTIAIGMTQFSGTAPLKEYTNRFLNLRVASMPGVLRRMEQTALAADYKVIGPRTHTLANHLTRSKRAYVEFSTGHRLMFDLRHRKGIADDGNCTPLMSMNQRLINLPSGEAFIVPYEGERPNEPSETLGEIPVCQGGETIVLSVERNRITKVSGDKKLADYFRRQFGEDPARSNIAELGLGCNDRAKVLGNTLEDEKVGFHWAYGRSEHLGGSVGTNAFKSHATVLHHDVVYAQGCPIGIRSLTLEYEDGETILIMENNLYPIFNQL